MSEPERVGDILRRVWPEMKILQALHEIREFLISKAGEKFDPEISAYLDSIEHLIGFLIERGPAGLIGMP